MIREDIVKQVAAILSTSRMYIDNHDKPLIHDMRSLGSVGEIAAWLSKEHADRVIELVKSNHRVDDIAWEILFHELEFKVRQAIADELGVDENEVTPNAFFVDDLGVDPLGIIDLILRFENEFDIEITEEDVQGMRVVDVYELISQHVIVERETG